VRGLEKLSERTLPPFLERDETAALNPQLLPKKSFVAMKPTSSLSLLLLVRLGIAAPIPIVLPNCQTEACTAFVANPNTPPTRLTSPYSPPHDKNLNIVVATEERFDNTPITPSASVSPDAALAALKPLSSVYLASLTNPASPPPKHNPIPKQETAAETENLPAKPTSALPKLREEDAKRYWALRNGAGADNNPLIEVVKTKNQVHPCTSDMLVQVTHTTTMRDYSDIMVVGIVLLFLAVVVALEAVEKIEAL
jgi:hypothetical protein